MMERPLPDCAKFSHVLPRLKIGTKELIKLTYMNATVGDKVANAGFCQ